MGFNFFLPALPIFLIFLSFSFVGVQCPPPPGIANGQHSGHPEDSYLPGSAVQYTCGKGYSLVGNASISCTADGTWSRPQPRCEGGFELASCIFLRALSSFGALDVITAVQISSERQRPKVPWAGGAPSASEDFPCCPPVRPVSQDQLNNEILSKSRSQ